MERERGVAEGSFAGRAGNQQSARGLVLGNVIQGWVPRAPGNSVWVPFQLAAVGLGVGLGVQWDFTVATS